MIPPRCIRRSQRSSELLNIFPAPGRPLQGARGLACATPCSLQARQSLTNCAYAALPCPEFAHVSVITELY